MEIETVRKFIEAVKMQASQYIKLKDIIQAEQKLLAAKEIKGLDEIVEKENKVVAEIKSLETAKRTAFEKMAKSAGLLPGPELRLPEVLLKLDPKAAGEIEKALNDLISAVKEIDLINSNNTHAIKNYLDYFEFMKGVKEKIEKPGQAVYTPGRAEDPGVRAKAKIDRTI